MPEILIYALGCACLGYSSWTLLTLGQHSRRCPTARDARTGRPMRIRLDRRRQGRRSSDSR